MSIPVEVVRVFTAEDGALGNELGVVLASEEVAGAEQEIAAQLGFSETVFVGTATDGVLPVRIFTPAGELPFAGHPSVGTAWWAARHGLDVQALAVPAGRVDVRRDGDEVWISARPEWAPEFVFTELPDAAAVDALDPAATTEGHAYFWAWTDQAAGALRSRMFAPAMGIVEDEATGAAAVRITALLGRDLDITQGRGCRIRTRLDGEIVHLGGRTAFDRTLVLG